MKKLPIGTSDFKSLREDDKYFVDKSMFIKEIIEEDAEVVLLPRPRRFGKTLNLSMLHWFFEVSENKEKRKKLFSGLNIEKDAAFEEHFAKYPVICLSFKDVRNMNFESAAQKIKALIAEEFERHDYLLDSNILSRRGKKYFKDILDMEPDLAAYENGLSELSRYLHKYHKQKPILLIDEYDTPIHAAFQYGYYEESISFFKSFLGAGLKDNPDIFKGVITGILRIAKESIFSGLNNLAVYTLLSAKFSDKFGLTQPEVDRLLKDFSNEDRLENIRDWYDGYVFGENKLYNPWSIINYTANIKDGFRPYWANTSSNEILRDLIKDGPPVIKQEFSDILKNIPIKKSLKENIVLRDLKKNEISLYSFLVFSGYLKAFDCSIDEEDNMFYKLLIPNKEVKQIFKDTILSWINESYENDKLRQMLNALIRCDIETFEEFLNDFVLSTLSYFDTEKRNAEKVYQAFILGMLVNLAPKYELYSNKESGLGRFDISLIPQDTNKTAFIMELKTIRRKETKDQSLEAALKQIKDRKYELDILKRGIKDIIQLAVVFDGKEVWVKKGY
jgi:hypothetical protein